MAKVKTKSCPNCSAPLPVSTATNLVCDYCGAHIEIEPPPPVAQRSPERQIPVQVVTPRTHKFLWLVILIPVALSGVGVFVGISKQKQAMQNARRDPVGGQSPKGEEIGWDDSAPVLVARINDDPVDDIIGRYWLYEDDKNNVYVAGFDGATFQRLWKAGPFGDISANTAQLYTFFAVTRSRVAVSDYASMLHILDRASGAELRSVRLSDRVQTICGFPDGADQVWLEVADENHVSVDLQTGETAKRSRPDWCPDEVSLGSDSACWHPDFQRKRQGRASCFAPDKLGKSQGFRPEYGLRSEDQVVALGHKDPGSQLPMAAGYVDNQPRWVRNISGNAQATVGEGTPKLADLAFGHLVVQYQLDKTWHMISLDPATGDTQWDVVIPSTEWSDESDLLLLTEDKLYLPSKRYLHVFDLATGRLLGSIGHGY